MAYGSRRPRSRRQRREAAAAVNGNKGHDAPAFSLELSEDQREIRDWVHGFAEQVVRPAAAEWDEREETPWPIIQEAAKIGLYGFEALAQFWSDPTGLQLPIANEELFWGDAGIGLSIMGTTLAVAGIYASGTPDQLVEWVPQCYGTPEEPKVAAFCSSEPDAGSDVSAIRTSARYDEAKDEWILNGQKAWATNGGIADVHVVIASVDRELGSRGHAAFVVPPGAEGLEQGAKVKKHGLRASHTADVHLDDCRVPGSCLLGGKEKLDERLARAREGKGSRGQAAMRTFEVSRPTVGAQALGIARAAYEYALDYAKQRVQFGRPIIENQAIAFTLADMKTEIDAARHARLARRLDGAHRQGLRRRRGLDVEAEGGRGGGLGHRAGDPDPRRQRLHPRVPGGADAPRRQDLHDLRGHVGDPATGDLPSDLGSTDPMREEQQVTEAQDVTSAADFSSLDPEQVAGTISSVTDEQLREALSGPQREAIIGEVFRRMEQHFKPSSAAGVDAVVHWKVTGRLGRRPRPLRGRAPRRQPAPRARTPSTSRASP